MRKFLKKISHPFIKKITGIYFSKPWKYSYQNITVTVHPKVFPPRYTLSTKVFLDFLDEIQLANKSFLELGCGTGIISLLAASKGAKVVSSDINQTALKYLKDSAQKNKLELEIVYSDLFTNIHQDSFDYIIINPPYYPKEPKNVKEQAWFCGGDFQYFRQLFHQLEQRKNDRQILMILSEDCKIEKIQKIAQQYHFIFECILEKKVLQEENFIFSIKKES